MSGIFRALFLAKTLLLTPTPVDIKPGFDLVLSTPISALTDAATLQIAISSDYPVKSGFSEALEAAKAKFPKGCVTADLSQSRGNRRLHLTYSGGFIGTRDGLQLLVEFPTKSPVDIKFDRLHVTSCKVIAKAKIYWHNTGGIR